MILYDVEKISSRHLAKIGVQIPPTESRCWHRQSRLQQPEIAQTCATPVPFDLISMNLQDLGEIEEYWSHYYSARRRRARPYFWFAVSRACLNFL